MGRKKGAGWSKVGDRFGCLPKPPATHPSGAQPPALGTAGAHRQPDNHHTSPQPPPAPGRPRSVFSENHRTRVFPTPEHQGPPEEPERTQASDLLRCTPESRGNRLMTLPSHSPKYLGILSWLHPQQPGHRARGGILPLRSGETPREPCAQLWSPQHRAELELWERGRRRPQR